MWGGGRDTEADPALAALLANARTTWSAAVPSSMAAAGLELSTNTSVMGIGGFSGSDPAPSLAQFQADVAGGRIHYFLADGRRGGRGGFGGGTSGTSGAITQWVQAHFRSTSVGGETVYDLTAPTS